MKVMPWDAHWEIGENLGAGGHGIAYRARRKNSGGDYNYVLKKLKNQQSPERRERLHHEVLALSNLTHSGIAKYIAGNTAQFGSTDIPLYLVTDFLPGGSIERKITTDGPLTLEAAVETIEKILNALEYCHLNGVIHRDIKPDNVILTSNGEPVLIDFGQCYIENEEPGNIQTPLWQDIGNRFIVLPEQRGTNATEESKRDHRSDIAAAVGLLFYMLTASQPGVLQDHELHLPHQRAENAQSLAAIAGQKLASLNQLFDRGFQLHWDRRFQSITELKVALSKLMASAQTAPSLEESLELLAAAPSYKQKAQTLRLLTTITAGIRNAFAMVGTNYSQNQFSTTQSGNILNAEYHRNELTLRNNLRPEIFIDPVFEVNVLGSQAIVTVTLDNDTEEMWRFDIETESNTHGMQDNIRAYFDRKIAFKIQEYI